MRALGILLLLGLLLGPRPGAAADLDHRWGLTQGLMAGIVVVHGVQPLAVAFGDLEWRPKHAVALAGTGLYGVALTGLALRQRWGLTLALVGPAAGLTAILGATVLDAVGVTDLGVRPDSFQVAGALLQIPTAILAVGLLRDSRVTVAAGPQGVALQVVLP